MNKFNQIIEAAVKDASVKPCRLNFTDMRFNARLRAKASGMERYYRAAELAFRKPKMAKKILQYLLTNLSAMISESVYIGHAISNNEPDVSAPMAALQSLYDNILSDRKIIDVQPAGTPSGVESFRSSDKEDVHREKVAKLYSWQRSVMKDANISGCSKAFKLAGLFQYAVVWKPARPNARPGDPTAICQKLLLQYVYPLEEARRENPNCQDCASSIRGFNLEKCRNLTEFVFDMRNNIVHHNLIPHLNDLNMQFVFNKHIDKHYYGKYTLEQKEILRCIAMTIAMPYVVSGLLNGPQLSLKPEWLMLCPPLWSKWKGQFPDYPMVDPILGHRLVPPAQMQSRNSPKGKTGNKASAIGNGLSYILRRGLQIAALFAIIICIRATIHHKRAGGICEHSSKEDICSYIKSMNNYDRALLLKERHKLLKRNPELLDERRENELHRRYSEEHWPEISFTRTLWHIGTPRWLHSGRTTTSSTSDPDRGTDMQNRTTTNPNLD